MLTTRRFWVAAGERSAKSLAQCLLGLWLADGFNLLQVDWQHSLGVGAGAALLSILTSVASGPIGPDRSPSLVGEPPKQPEALLENESGDHALDGQPRPGQDRELPANLFEARDRP